MMTIQTTPRPGNRLRRRIRAFRKEEDGGMIAFTLYILIMMMLAIGMSLDTVRFEYTRANLQHTLDRAVLAAANLEQVLDPTDVVEDYFEKAGLSENLMWVNVEQGVNYRTVTAQSGASMETAFMDMIGIENLSVTAAGEANETLADIEVALVLDNSGSMGNTAPDGQTRLQLLKTAAKEFVDSVAREEGDDGTTSLSIIPFAEQVAISPSMLKYYNYSADHDHSYCITFEDADFQTAELTPTQALKQTAFFDDGIEDWTVHELDYCDPSGDRDIAPWSTDATYLKGRVDSMVSDGWTSIDVATKWGVAMLDPSSQPVLTSLIADGVVDAELAGQPFAYSRDNTMKILVVMSDGANTYQRDVEDGYRSGDSTLFFRENWSEKYSTNSYDDDDFYTYYDSTRSGNKYWRKGSYEDCNYYGCKYKLTSSKSWYSTPLDGSSKNTRLTWAEVWEEMTLYSYAYYYGYKRDSSKTARQHYYGIFREIGVASSSSSYSGNEKNGHTSDICSAAKDEGILIFTIGMDTDNTAADMTLEDCATLPSYYYDVESLDISNAFASIALQINQLRLTQ